MNRTHIEHLAIAIGLQLMLWPFFGSSQISVKEEGDGSQKG